ncbi:uncharacterized protein LOC129231701 [Uloborus diversus]|uniref:uncharacterized protein LOC129231701 n=1 Tax=Uloborus diversus TaxID=327109 RepID=UPI00240A47E2|nr:uncharacterized protein LOC129231701 [Uloborus diversus]
MMSSSQAFPVVPAMDLKNVYLKETHLTSTKNYILEESTKVIRDYIEKYKELVDKRWETNQNLLTKFPVEEVDAYAEHRPKRLRSSKEIFAGLKRKKKRKIIALQGRSHKIAPSGNEVL